MHVSYFFTMKSLELFLLVIASGTFSAVNAQKRSDDQLVGELETTVDNLAAQVTSLTAELTALKSKVTSQDAKLDTLSHSVAFFAVSESTTTTSPGAAIIVSDVHTNIGDAYDAQTGYFTAPVSGVYQFAATYMANPNNGATYVHAEIVVNGRMAAVSISDSRHGYYDHTSLHAVEHVQAGQRVYLKNTDAKVSIYYGSSYLSFSGFLLRAD